MENNSKLRSTSQRQLVLTVVGKSSDHPNAEQIYARCKHDEPSISMGTVYRNLGVLAETGDILHLSMPQGPDHYDFNTKPHCHFFCRCCRGVFDIDEPQIVKPLNKKLSIPGYKVENHQMIICGVCPECLKKEEDHA